MRSTIALVFVILLGLDDRENAVRIFTITLCIASIVFLSLFTGCADQKRTDNAIAVLREAGFQGRMRLQSSGAPLGMTTSTYFGPTMNLYAEGEVDFRKDSE